MATAGQNRNWTFVALLLALLAVVPLASVGASFFSGDADAFSHLLSTILPVYAANSLLLMILVGTVTILVGTGTAWLVATCAFPGRKVLSWLLVLPIAAPAYIVAYLYTDLLDFAGPVQTFLRSVAGEGFSFNIRTLPGAALMLSLVLYPYVYLLARASFGAQSRSQLLAARTLSLSPHQVFLRVGVPAARPAIFGGAALVLMETLADFGVAEYFGVPTFSTGIFRTWFALGDRQAAMQLAGVMLIFVMILVTLEASSRRGRVASTDRLAAGPPPFRLRAGASLLAQLACSLPVILGFVVPATLLISNVAEEVDGRAASDFGAYALNSIGLGLITTGIAALLAVVLAYASRQSRGPIVRAGVRLSTLGYALPGALLAVGLLAPLGPADQMLTRFARDQFDWTNGLILTGTVAILVYALVVRFLTVAFNSAEAGMAKIGPALDAVARSLGATESEVVRRIHLPLLGPQLAVGAALVFVDVVRELPATLILRPFNFETLATRVYRLASDERIVEASSAALVIVLVGLLPVVILNGQLERKTGAAENR